MVIGFMKSKIIKPKKRETPEGDLDRFAENFWTSNKDKVRDWNSFNMAYDDWIGGNDTEFTRNAKKAVWDTIVGKPQITRRTEIEAKPMKRGKPKQFAVRKRILDRPARVKGAFVYAEMIRIKRYNKEVNVYMDERGRFARLIKNG